MKVINFIGQPGGGKSTLAAGLFYLAKRAGVNCELVTEYTKDAIYEGHSFILDDELLVFAEKYKRIKRLARSVDLVVTDSPLINAIFYSDEFGSAGTEFFRTVAQSFDNFYVYVRRVVPYVPHARIPDSKEADRMDGIIKGWLDSQGGAAISVDGDDSALSKIWAKLSEEGLVPFLPPVNPPGE